MKQRSADHTSKEDAEGFVRGRIEDSFSLKVDSAANVSTATNAVSVARFVFVTITGALLGMLLSIAVNSVLFEISINRLFAFYFGLVFCLIGGLIFLRAWTQPSIFKKLTVLVLAIVVISGGACSFVFRTNWLWWPSLWKVMVYTLLGISTSFTVTFSWVDIVSFLHDLAKRRENNSNLKYGLIESPIQVWLVLLISVVTGVAYGLIFGLVQIEEMTVQHHSRDRLMLSLGRTELFSLPFGAVVGGLGAIINDLIRHHMMIKALKKEIVEYKPLNQTDIDGV